MTWAAPQDVTLAQPAKVLMQYFRGRDGVPVRSLSPQTRREFFADLVGRETGVNIDTFSDLARHFSPPVQAVVAWRKFAAGAEALGEDAPTNRTLRMIGEGQGLDVADVVRIRVTIDVAANLSNMFAHTYEGHSATVDLERFADPAEPLTEGVAHEMDNADRQAGRPERHSGATYGVAAASTESALGFVTRTPPPIPFS